jgi:hypothetical protein
MKAYLVYHEEKKFYKGTRTGFCSTGYNEDRWIKCRDPIDTPLPPFDYGKIQGLDDAITTEGLIILRIEPKSRDDKWW